MNTIKKIFITLICSLVYTSSFSQLTMVPGQPENKGLSSRIQIDDNFHFLIYYSRDDGGETLYSFNGEVLEEIDFGLMDSYLQYTGTLNNRYYFHNQITTNEIDGVFYEYNRNTNETTSIPLPNDSYYNIWRISTMNDKLYFYVNYPHELMSYDGNVFEAIANPVSAEYSLRKEYYSSAQNLMYLEYFFTAQSESKLYTYDGTDFNEIQLPENMVVGTFFDDFDSKVIIVMGERNAYNPQLYACDGNTLTHITPGENMLFEFASTRYKESKRYYNFSDATIQGGAYSFYEYDGSNLSLIASHPEHNGGLFLSEFDGKDYFGITKSDTQKNLLYSYDGANLTLIEGEESSYPLVFFGVSDNKLYTLFQKEDLPHVLTSYSPGDIEVTPISNIPEFSSLSYQTSFQDMLIHEYRISYYPEDPVYEIYSMTSSNEFFELEVPGFHNPIYFFRIDDKLYFAFRSQYNSLAKLFSWDGVLSVPDNEYSKNEVLIFPNPAKDNLTVQFLSFPNTREVALKIYSIDGKQMGKYLFEANSPEMDVSVAHLVNGMYILEIINDSGSIYKKFIKD